MARKILDLNTVERPEMELTLQDAEKTTLILTTPTEALVQELMDASDKLDGMKHGDAAAIKALYGLTANLLSYNVNGVHITAEELKDRYKFTLETFYLFYAAYFEFIREIQSLKN